ncbi:MAG TPA: DUF3332 family protein [Planctomycetota bacterium]
MKTLFCKVSATFALAACLTTSSCLGPNNAFNSLQTWNSKLSETKWVNEAAFLGLNIIPVYPIFLLGDYFVFNSVEFWTGNNWISKPEPYKPQETPGEAPK